MLQNMSQLQRKCNCVTTKAISSREMGCGHWHLLELLECRPSGSAMAASVVALGGSGGNGLNAGNDLLFSSGVWGQLWEERGRRRRKRSSIQVIYTSQIKKLCLLKQRLALVSTDPGSHFQNGFMTKLVYLHITQSTNNQDKPQNPSVLSLLSCSHSRCHRRAHRRVHYGWWWRHSLLYWSLRGWRVRVQRTVSWGLDP